MNADPMEQYGTERQVEVWRAYQEHGSNRKAAKALGIDQAAVGRHIKALKTRAARAGYAPEHDMTHPAPDGLALKKISLNYNADGDVSQQWVMFDVDRQRQVELFKAAIEALKEEVPRAAPRPAPAVPVNDLANCYVLTDYHLGMLAWPEETGAAWDMKIAEKLLVDWFGAAISQSPKANAAILAQLGDFLHWDGMDAVTPASGHNLDSDTRFQLVVRSAIRVVQQIIEMLLGKYPEVRLIMAEGNHDPASSVWLRELLDALYRDEPRVTVDTRPDPFYCYEHGKTALFFHHGHRKRVGNIDSVFAAKFRETFGRTKRAYAHTGHLHHRDLKETNLMIVEQHRTLAAPDAYASSHGFMSGRSASVITYHKEHGEVGRITLTPEAVS